MKKIVSFFIAALIALLSACSAPIEVNNSQSAAVSTIVPEATDPVPNTETPSAEPTEDPDAWPDGVLLVKDDSMSEAPEAHAFDLDEKSVSYVDESKVGATRTIEIAGVRFETEYSKTVDYIIGEYTVDEYLIVNDVNGVEDVPQKILFLPDGTFISLFNGFISVEIDDITADAETVRAIIEDALKDVIDFSRFECFDSISTSQSPEDGFGVYYLYWLNMIGDFSDCAGVRVSVSQDGNILSIKRIYAAYEDTDDLPDPISKESIDKKVQAVLNNLYGDSIIMIQEFGSEVTRYNGEYYVYETIGIQYTKANGNPSDTAFGLLIPVEP